jgi:hypothetical protein
MRSRQRVITANFFISLMFGFENAKIEYSLIFRMPNFEKVAVFG